MNATAKSKTPWKVPDKWSVSRHSFELEVRANWCLPKRITVHDVTLRDGEQTPGVVFRKEEKLEIAHALADAGVTRIEGGMVAVSPEDAEAISQIVKEVKNAEIASFLRARMDDVDKALKARVHRGVIEMGASDALIQQIWGGREKAAETISKVIQHAKTNGLKVTFFIMFSAIADLELLEQLIVPIASEGKPDSIAIVDTQGNIYPAAFAWLVTQVKKMTDLPIEIHCHNNFGLGTATTLAGITAGAEIMHTCINGMGGNASIDECVLGAEALLGVETGVNTQGFRQLSAMVKEMSGADWYKPFVGSLTSQVEVGIATQWMWDKRDVPGMGKKEEFNYEIVGGKAAEVVLGKKSGKYSIMLKAMEFNLPMPSDEQIVEILNRVKDLSIQHKGLVTDDEFKKIYRDVSG